MYDIISGRCKSYKFLIDSIPYCLTKNFYNSHISMVRTIDKLTIYYPLRIISFNVTIYDIYGMDNIRRFSVCKYIHKAVLGVNYYDIYSLFMQIVNNDLLVMVIKKSQYDQLKNNMNVLI